MIDLGEDRAPRIVESALNCRHLRIDAQKVCGLEGDCMDSMR